MTRQRCKITDGQRGTFPRAIIDALLTSRRAGPAARLQDRPAIVISSSLSSEQNMSASEFTAEPLTDANKAALESMASESMAAAPAPNQSSGGGCLPADAEALRLTFEQLAQGQTDAAALWERFQARHMCWVPGRSGLHLPVLACNLEQSWYECNGKGPPHPFD